MELQNSKDESEQYDKYPIFSPIIKSCQSDDKTFSGWKVLLYQRDQKEGGLFDWERRFSTRDPHFPGLDLRSQSIPNGSRLAEVEEKFGPASKSFMMESVATSVAVVGSIDELTQRDNRPFKGNRGRSHKVKCLTQAEKPVNECGITSCRPEFLQSLANIKMFTLAIAILITFQQALTSGYSSAVVTTIEKRYEIPSKFTGLISSCAEVGNLFSVLFVSYLGSKRKRPVWIAVGCLAIGCGAFLFSLPQILLGRWSLSGGGQSTNQSEWNNICHIRTESDVKIKREKCKEEVNINNIFPIVIFALSYALMGIGGSPLQTLGSTYIDDHVTKQSSPLYIGIMYTMAGLGPVVGFLIGAFFLSIYVDTFFVPAGDYSTLDQTHPRWIGMWWGGYLLLGLIISCLSLAFFMFPKTLSRDKARVIELEKAKSLENKMPNSATSTISVHSNSSNSGIYGRSIKEIPKATLKLITNPIFMITCLATSFEIAIVAGFILFMPKYMENQFSMSSVKASILTGGVAIPGACIGIFLGGYLMKRFSLQSKGAIQMIIFFNAICLCLYGVLFFLGCSNTKMAGTTHPYIKNQQRNSKSKSNESKAFEVNLTAACNMDCYCTKYFPEPVCGGNGMTYFSPCHAGCTSSSGNSTYENCRCIEESISEEVFSEAKSGSCFASCSDITPFMIVLFLMASCVAVNQMPGMMIALRCVREEERSFALGLRFVIFRLLAYIPAPIVFGSVIDSTCLLWRTSCEGDKEGRCLVYDIEKLRFRMTGFFTIIKIVSTLTFLFDFFLIKKKEKKNDNFSEDNDDTETETEISESTINDSVQEQRFKNVFISRIETDEKGSPSFPHSPK